MSEVSARQEETAGIRTALVREEIGTLTEIVAHQGQQIDMLVDATGEVGERMSEMENAIESLNKRQVRAARQEAVEIRCSRQRAKTKREMVREEAALVVAQAAPTHADPRLGECGLVARRRPHQRPSVGSADG